MTPQTELSARLVPDMMRRSIFFFCPPTTRFFEAVLNCCVPVVVAYNAVVGRGQQANGISFVKSTLKIDFESIVIVLTEEVARSALATRQVLTDHLSSSFVAEKRARLLEICSLLSFLVCYFYGRGGGCCQCAPAATCHNPALKNIVILHFP